MVSFYLKDTGIQSYVLVIASSNVLGSYVSAVTAVRNASWAVCWCLIGRYGGLPCCHSLRRNTRLNIAEENIQKRRKEERKEEGRTQYNSVRYSTHRNITHEVLSRSINQCICQSVSQCDLESSIRTTSTCRGLLMYLTIYLQQSNL